ncbi:MAG: hypothetical protein KA369_08275 [Spirochaetes bacterium]|nr:hypothetical protein [Spirochaetota bacterium]
MTVKAGPVESVSIKGRTFSVAADADVARDLGGAAPKIELNGDDTGRVIQEKVPWKLAGLSVQIDDDRGDQEFLQDIRDAGEFVDVSATFADGSVYFGQGIVTDKAERASKTGLMDISLEGPGKLKKQ